MHSSKHPAATVYFLLVEQLVTDWTDISTRCNSPLLLVFAVDFSMDFPKILVYVVTGCLLFVDQVSAYVNQTNGDITFIFANVPAVSGENETSLTVAQNWCQSKGYTLAQITDEGVQNYIQQFIKILADYHGVILVSHHIILNGKLNSSLPGTWMWVNGQPKNGIDIQDKHNLSQVEFYGYLNTSDFKLHASSHHIRKPYICEKPGNVNDCVGGQSLNGRCYQRKTNPMSWYRARNYCIEGGGDLASFDTLNDTTFNSTLGSQLLANESPAEYWVGMQRVEWRWEDGGLPIKYTNWEDYKSPSNKPNEECLSYRHLSGNPDIDWMWYSCDCSTDYRFICTATSRTTLAPTIPTSSTATMDASSTKSTTGSVISTPTSPSFSVQPASNSSASYIPTTHATNRTTLVPTIPISSTATMDASSTNSTSRSVVPTPTSPSFSVQPTSNLSASFIPTTQATNRTTLAPTILTSSTATMDASSTNSTSRSVFSTPTSPSFSVQPASNSSASYIPTTYATTLTTLVPTITTSSTATMDASSTNSTTGSVISTPNSPSFSVQPASNSSASYIPTTQATNLTTFVPTIPTSSTVAVALLDSSTTKNDYGLALGLGIGLGVGALVLLVAIIICAVVFSRRRQKKKTNRNSKQGDTTIPMNRKESDAAYAEIENNGTKKHGASTGNANPGPVYATVQPKEARFPPTNHEQIYEPPIAYADLDLIQNP